MSMLLHQSSNNIHHFDLLIIAMQLQIWKANLLSGLRLVSTPLLLCCSRSDWQYSLLLTVLKSLTSFSSIDFVHPGLCSAAGATTVLVTCRNLITISC